VEKELRITIPKRGVWGKCVGIILYMTVFAIARGGMLLGGLQAQSPAATPPQFEVSVVRQNVSQSTESKISSSAEDRFVATNVPVRFLILYAYGLLDHQLVSAPAWTLDKAFDIVGAYPGERRPPEPEIRVMLQNLLMDRFDLKLHQEQRELSAYDLVIARKDGRMGPQLHKSDMNCAAWIAENQPNTAAGRPSPLLTSGKRPICTMIATRKSLTGGARTTQDLAHVLQSMLGRPVVDRTGLTDSYDIDLQWARMDLQADEAAVATASDGPSLFTALQEQLGFKLLPHKEKFTVFVIDEIKLPTPN
jgi:uncharacterized protein (TIGR03435 family)